jgi:hypothetical protein
MQRCSPPTAQPPTAACQSINGCNVLRRCCCFLSSRRLPERPQKPHKQLTATQRAAAAAAAAGGVTEQKRSWLPWRRNKAAPAAASELTNGKPASNKAGNGAVTVVRVEDGSLQHLNGNGSAP